MQVIIAGSRGIEDPQMVAAAIAASGYEITEVLSGTCRGVDQTAERWAESVGVPVNRFPAQWQRFGRSAGPRRNMLMIEHIASSGQGALIAVWDGRSPGTRHIIDYARRRGVAVYVHLVASTQSLPHHADDRRAHAESDTHPD
jgi:hypothetical protein